MAMSMTFTGESAQAIRGQMEDLLRAWDAHPTPEQDPLDGDAPPTTGDRVKMLLEQLSANPKRMLLAHAALPEPSTIEDLTTFMGVEEKTVKAWMRNVGKILARVDLALGIDSSESPLTLVSWEWDDQNGRYRNYYRFPEAVRAAISEIEH